MASNLRILLAEDNEVNQHLMLRIFARLGYEAELAQNGIQVLNKMDKADYDLIFMDIMMPKMDGVQATRLIRYHYSEEKQPKIYALTAETSIEGREKYLAAGMNGVFTKPIKVDEIKELLASLEENANEARPEDDHEQNRASALSEFPVLELNVIKEFMQLMGEDGKDAAIHLTDLYLDSSPDLIKKIEISYRVKDQADLLRQLHTLKGSSSQIGAKRMEQLCSRLEVLVKQSGLEPFGTFLTGIRQEFVEVQSALAKFVSLIKSA